MIFASWIAYDYIYYKVPRSKVESGFKNFYANNQNRFNDDELPVNKSHISEYSMQSMTGNDHYNRQYEPPKIGGAF